MSARDSARKYDQARVQAELDGKISYAGSPCRKTSAHVDEDGTTQRDTIKYGCVHCTRAYMVRRREKQRQQYAKKKQQA